MDKVVFLDIDGVLNSGLDGERLEDIVSSNLSDKDKCYEIQKEFNTFGLFKYNSETDCTHLFPTSGSYNLISKNKLKLFKHFAEVNKVDTVVVVSSVAICRDILYLAELLELPCTMIRKGIYCSGGHMRGQGVLRFVKENNVQNWCVIDDAGGNCYSFPTVNVNGRIGLTWRDIKQAEHFLRHCLAVENCQDSNIYS